MAASIHESEGEVLKLENQLCFAVYACSREITKLYRPLLEELGLTYTQYITMLALWEKDQVTVKELGARLYLDSGTLTPLLKKLEQMGILSRKRDLGDERSVRIQLTEAGQRMKERASNIPAQMFCQGGISVQEAIQLRDQVKELLHHIHLHQQGEDESNEHIL